MLVSHRKRFIYTKTVKTAGTSVEVYFEPWCREGAPRRIRHRTDAVESEAGIVGFRGRKKPLGCRWYNHMPASDIRTRVGEEIWNDYFKFCVVRDPFDKAVSAFYHFKKAREERLQSGKPVPLAQRLKSWLRPPRRFDSVAEEFADWLERGGLAPDRDKYVIDGRICVDEFIHYEALHEGVRRVCERIGEPFDPGRLPELKTATRDKAVTLAEIYTPRSLETVSRLFDFEIREFGYRAPG